jgi:hypothetical protein
LQATVCIQKKATAGRTGRGMWYPITVYPNIPSTGMHFFGNQAGTVFSACARSSAWAAASRAIGTRNGEQET